MDYELSALLMCRMFGWTLEYAMSLPITVFLGVVARLQEVSATITVQETYLATQSLFSKEANAYLVKRAKDPVTFEDIMAYKYTDEDVERAKAQGLEVARQFMDQN